MRMRAAKFGLFALLFVAGACVGAEQSSRPNILFVFADDWGRQASAYAKVDGPGTINDIARTPNFDRIASDGVLFRNAFVNAPSCTPQRAAFWSVFLAHRTRRNSARWGVGRQDSKLAVATSRQRLSHWKELESLEPRYSRRCAVWQAAIRLSKSWRPH